MNLFKLNKDVITAEHFYTKAVNKEPSNDKALLNLRRTLPLVNKLDRIMFDELDSLLKKFYEIPVSLFSTFLVYASFART